MTIDYERRFMVFIGLFIFAHTVNGVITIFHNRSLPIEQLISNRTKWKKSSSIETLKKLIANRKLLSTSNFHFIIQYKRYIVNYLCIHRE
jgi:hypothetical protein